MKLSDIMSASNEGPKPETPSVLSNLTRIPREAATNTFHDLSSGIQQFGQGLDESGQKMVSEQGSLKSLIPGKETVDTVAGALGAIGSPVTGTAKALGDAVRRVIPQDTPYGKFAGNLVEEGTAIFGPGEASKIVDAATSAAKAAGPVKQLVDSGVKLTLGQFSPDHAKRLEEAAKSFPILGHFIRSAEKRSFDSFNVAAANKALEPIGVKIDAANSREAMPAGHKALSDAYNKTLGNIPSVHQDAQFDGQIGNLKSMVAELGPDYEKQFDAILNNRIYRRFGPLKAMDGRNYKEADSELGMLSGGMKSDPDSTKRNFGHAIDAVRGALRDSVAAQYPMQAPKLRAIDKAFAQFADVERAAGASAVNEGLFTPGQYLQALKRGDRSARDHRFLAGDVSNQKWAEAAQKVMGNKLPDSGTSGRMMAGLGLEALTEGGLVEHGHFGPLVATGIASLPYTKLGQRAVNAIIPNAGKYARKAGAAIGDAGGASEVSKQLGITQ